MSRIFVVAFVLFAFMAEAQTRKPAPKKPVTAAADTVQQDSALVQAEEPEFVPEGFMVYTKRSKKERTKLCLNLVSQENVLNYCVNDSMLHDPEVYKLLFEARHQDTTYSLIYASAFTKDPQEPQCYSGKEVKLFFVRWNTKTNKAIVRSRKIQSCKQGITNMTKEPIEDWDRQGPLVVNYNRGLNFIELKFDPANYRIGWQAANELETD